MGGIASDLDGRSSLEGLWVAGETASTGAHGANRLASNSLLEAIVFGARVAADVGQRLPSSTGMVPVAVDDRADEHASDAGDVALLRTTMSAHVWVVRDRAGLVG